MSNRNSFIADGNAKWYGHIVRPFVKFLAKLNIVFSYHLGINPTHMKTSVHIKTYTQMFTEDLFAIASNWKQVRCL